MWIEVVYGDAHEQTLLKCEVEPGANAKEAIQQSGILTQYPKLNIDSLNIGIFSEKVPLTSVLQEGDRVEIYRPLIIDPKEARRQRAKKR